MQLFLDTANVQEIRQAVRWGVVSGITTNPSLAAKEQIGDLDSYRRAIDEIGRLVPGPISAEVLSLDAEGMIREGRVMTKWGSNIWVKLPSTPAGFEAMAVLSKEKIAINQTLCFSVNQAILGARAGTTVVSPFVGRLDDEGHDGMEVVKDIVQIYRQYNLPVKVMAASIRHPLHVIAAAKAGADISTIPFKVLEQMAHHPLTDVGVARFTQDWKKAIKV